MVVAAVLASSSCVWNGAFIICLGTWPSSYGVVVVGISDAASRLCTSATMAGSSVLWAGPLFLALFSEVESAVDLIVAVAGGTVVVVVALWAGPCRWQLISVMMRSRR